MVLVRVPFSDLTSTKQRPAVIVSPTGFSARYGDCVLVPLTSQPQPDAKLMLDRSAAAGLIKPTWAKPVVGTLSAALVVKRLGRLDPVDDPAIRAALAEAIDGRW